MCYAPIPSFRRRPLPSSSAPAPNVIRVPRITKGLVPIPPVLGRRGPVLLVQVMAMASEERIAAVVTVASAVEAMAEFSSPMATPLVFDHLGE